jgi:hypothetical protein
VVANADVEAPYGRVSPVRVEGDSIGIQWNRPADKLYRSKSVTAEGDGRWWLSYGWSRIMLAMRVLMEVGEAEGGVRWAASRRA